MLGGHDRDIIRKMVSRHHPEKNIAGMSDEDIDAEIRWLPLVDPNYWMSEFDGASING